MSSKTLPLLATTALLLAPLTATAASAQEIELHIEALGDAQPRSARVEFEIQYSAESPEAAERGLAAAKADLTRKFGEIGIKPQQISFGDMSADLYPPPVPVAIAPPPITTTTTPKVTPVGVPPSPLPPPPAIKTAPSPRPVVAKLKDNKRSTVTISLDDLGKLEAVRSKARDFSRTSYSQPRVIYAQRNPAEARDEAVAKAIAQARTEADRYASAMGYKVVRITRVSNAKPVLNVPDLVQMIFNFDRRTGDSERLMAAVWAGVAIDFVIAPK